MWKAILVIALLGWGGYHWWSDRPVAFTPADTRRRICPISATGNDVPSNRFACSLRTSTSSRAGGFGYASTCPGATCPRAVFANALVLRPGETKRVTVAFRPPRGVVLRTPAGPAYRLSVQKQPGDRAVPFSFRLRLPPDTRPAASDPPGLRTEGDAVLLDTELLYDRVVQVVIGR